MKDEPTNSEIIAKYNENKQKYSLFFQKALEIEQELIEHNLVANTLTTVEGNRRCWRMIGGVLVEKDLTTVKKDLDVQIGNIKQTLEVVYKSMKQQEEILKEFEKKYSSVLQGIQVNKNEKKESEQGKSIGGVLV